MSFLVSREFSLTSQPFYLTKFCCRPRCLHDCMLESTSYSTESSGNATGGGAGGCRLYGSAQYGFSNAAWKAF